MMRILNRIGAIGLCIWIMLLITLTSVAQETQFAPVLVYDATRDAQKDLTSALQEARRTGKRVWLQVGSDDCVACNSLDAFVRNNKELSEKRDKNFVVLFVNSSDSNRNEQTLSKYPRVKSFPQLILLDAQGKLLVSVGPDALRERGAFSLSILQDLVDGTLYREDPEGFQRPPDRPLSANVDEASKIERAIAPYIDQARSTLPTAKQRYLAGLPSDQLFDITMKLRDSDGKFEIVFVRVTSWQGTKIRGVLDSNLELLKEHHNREIVLCDESDVMDWTISHSDRTEEGNFVGKFLDNYQKN